MKSTLSFPKVELPVWSGIVNPALYGIKTHADFLNRRQRMLLVYLIKELIEEYNRLSANDEIMAKFVIGVLASLIDQVVDWNCRMSMWIGGNEQVGRAFVDRALQCYGTIQKPTCCFTDRQIFGINWTG